MSRLTLLFAPLLGLALVGCDGKAEDTGGWEDTAAAGDTATADTDTTDTDTASVELATMYAARGEHAVGYAVLDASAGLEVKAWYPTAEAGGAEIVYSVLGKFPGLPTEVITIHGTAHRDASPGAGPYPLVVLSHGFSMNPEWYPLAEHLASHGFVVLGPEHTEFDWGADIVSATIARPADVSATIDLAEEGALAGAIDATNVAVVGHSYGGYTALAAAGARFDLDSLAARCVSEEDPFIFSYFCEPFVDAGAQLADLMGLDAAPAGLWPALADSRVDAIVPIAGDAYLFGDDGLAEVTVPAMMIGGTADSGTPWDWGTGMAFDAVSSDYRALVGLEGAEHFIPITSCDNMPFTDDLGAGYRSYICEDPAWGKGEALDVIHHLTTAFLLDVMTQDSGAAAALDASLYEGTAALDVMIERH